MCERLDYDVVSKNLKRLMVETNMPISVLAKKLNCNVDSIKNYMKGRTSPRAITLQEMAEIFNVDISEFFR